MAMKDFYVDETNRVVIAEDKEDFSVNCEIADVLEQNGFPDCFFLISELTFLSSNPKFKTVSRCSLDDKFDEKIGKRIASQLSDYKRNNYTIKQINHVIDKLHDAIDVLTDYRYKLLKRQNEINENLKEYKN